MESAAKHRLWMFRGQFAKWSSAMDLCPPFLQLTILLKKHIPEQETGSAKGFLRCCCSPVCILTSRRQKFLWRKQVSTHVSTLAPPTSRNISFLQRRDALRAKSRSCASFEGVHSSSVPAFSDIHVVLNSVPHIIFQAAAPKLGQWRPSIEYQSSSTLSSTVLGDFKIGQKMPHGISCVHYSGSKT